MKFKLPESYVLILIIVLIASIASYIVPAGEYERVYDDTLNISSVVDGSYHAVESSPIGIGDFLNSIPSGMMEASDLIIFVLIIGGAFGIITATGAVSGLVKSLLHGYEGKEKAIIFKIMIVFALGGTIFGMAEETLPFYPVFIMMALAMNFDKITGVALIFISSIAGFAAGVINPFTTGIAQNISGLPLFSGVGLRVAAFLIFFLTGYIYVYRHAMSVRKNGVVDTYDYYMPEIEDGDGKLRRTDKLVGGVVALSIIYLAYGIYRHQFALTEMATVFLVMGVVSGIVAGMKSGRIISEFTSGASNLLYSAMIIGLARAVLSVLESGKILDTIIYGLSSLIGSISPALTAITMFLVQSALNILISSGTGQATVTMPIMANIADLEGITRQTAVLAYQFGDGLVNIVTPTSGLLMATLAISDIEWRTWVKWVTPLLILWMIEGCVILSISCIINYGPF